MENLKGFSLSGTFRKVVLVVVLSALTVPALANTVDNSAGATWHGRGGYNYSVIRPTWNGHGGYNN